MKHTPTLKLFNCAPVRACVYICACVCGRQCMRAHIQAYTSLHECESIPTSRTPTHCSFSLSLHLRGWIVRCWSVFLPSLTKECLNWARLPSRFEIYRTRHCNRDESSETGRKNLFSFLSYPTYCPRDSSGWAFSVRFNQVRSEDDDRSPLIFPLCYTQAGWQAGRPARGLITGNPPDVYWGDDS